MFCVHVLYYNILAPFLQSKNDSRHFFGGNPLVFCIAVSIFTADPAPVSIIIACITWVKASQPGRGLLLLSMVCVSSDMEQDDP
jgi:hypothetical protein